MKKKITCEVWTRTVGYFRPVSQMNSGKKEEVKDRYLQNPKELEKKL
jgi:anaerobic ribonucleoside-triphosphate reductase